MGEHPADKYKRVRQLGLLTMIPMILAVAPLIGYYMGSWIDGKFGTDPVFSLIFLALGLFAGARETISILQKAQEKDE